MNYCILNGKKSTLIKGLLIQSLPPITKPLQRTQIDEIDGGKTHVFGIDDGTAEHVSRDDVQHVVLVLADGIDIV